MSLIAHTSGGGGVSPATTPPINTIGATLIVIAGAWSDAGSFTSLTDNLGNVFTPLTSQDSSAAIIRLFYCSFPLTSTSHTFTLAATGSLGASLVVEAHSGYGAYAGLQNGAGGGSGTSLQPGSVTPSGSCLVISAALSFISPTVNSGFTITDTQSYLAMSMAYVVTSSSVNPTWSTSFSGRLCASIAVFSPVTFSIGGGIAATVDLTGGVSIPNVTVGGASAFSMALTGGVSIPSSTIDVPGSGAFAVDFTGGVSLSTPGLTVGGATAMSLSLGGSFFIGSGIPVAGGFSALFDLEGGISLGLELSCPLGCATIGEAYTGTVVASGGVGPYAFSLLPGPNVPQNINAVFLGDSMVRGDYPPETPPVTPWPTQLGEMLGFTPINLGIDGETTAGVLTNEIPFAVAIPGRSNRAYVLCGVNDFGTGVPQGTVQANYQAIVAQLQAKGFFVQAQTISPSNYTAYPNYPDYIAEVVTFDEWLLSGGSGADAVSNSGGDNRLANPANTIFFYSDELHLVNAGLTVVAQNAGVATAPPLPPGLSLNQTTGVISGTPTSLGTFPFQIQVTDANGNSVTKACSIVVSEPSGDLGITISTLTANLSRRLGLKLAVQDFWTLPELDLYVRMSIREFQVLTNYWRGSVTVSTSTNAPFYDLHALGYIPYTVLDTDILNQVGYHLLEFSGTQPTPINTKQFTLGALTNAFDQRREEILGETRLVVKELILSAPSAQLALPSTILQVHRAEWLGSGIWRLVSRTDELGGYGWSYGWTGSTATAPSGYSSADTPPFELQFIPPPSAAGSVSLLVTMALPYVYGCDHTPELVQIPDDSTFALPWGILASMLSQDAQSRDTGRASYCQKRFRDALAVLKTWPCVMNGFLNGVQILPDTLFSLDHWMRGWRNLPTAEPTNVAIGGRNLIACAPIPNTVYRIFLDCVVNSPGSIADRYQVFDMAADIETAILNNAYHTACFKLQGREFGETMDLRKEFLLVAQQYADRERAQSINWKDLLGTTEDENAQRPYEQQEVEA